MSYTIQSNKKALIIDDEQDICLLLAAILRKNDFLTDFANNQADGEEKLEAFKPHLIILDLNLPDGNGFNLIPKIKKVVPKARIVVCSAYDGPNEQNRARLEGADAFIGKPLDRDKLQSIIKSISVEENKR